VQFVVSKDQRTVSQAEVCTYRVPAVCNASRVRSVWACVCACACMTRRLLSAPPPPNVHLWLLCD
jgi:hypothetical protein